MTLLKLGIIYMEMWIYSILFLAFSLVYIYRVKLGHIILSLLVPYILEYIIENPKILPIGEKEIGEAEVVGRLVKIPFRFNGQEYTYWTIYNRRANSEVKYYMVKDGHEDVDMNWCPWVPLTITSTDLKVDKIDCRVSI